MLQDLCLGDFGLKSSITAMSLNFLEHQKEISCVIRLHTVVYHLL